MSKMLMKVQVGPVQEFIAQARSTRDMWAGSYLLSRLTARAMEVFDRADCSFVFPALEGQPLYEMVVKGKIEHEAGLIPTLPNVFMLQVEPGQAADLAKAAMQAMHDELTRLGDLCWSWLHDQEAKPEWKARWDAQLKAFPSLTWHAVEVQKGWPETVALLGEELAARRNTRDFDQWGLVLNEKKNLETDKTHWGSSKDVLSGKEEIIGDDVFWDKIKSHEYINNAGPLGAVNLVKRLFPYCCFPGSKEYWKQLSVDDTRTIASKNNPEKGFNPYIAVLAMDGDKMGAALKELKSQEEHTDFSQTLAKFAQEQVKPLVDECSGQLVYAGGDDVLAMCPADQALILAEKLCATFRKWMKTDTYALDASCGIAVGHYQFPLQRLVEEARAAETRAKNKRGRAAFALALLKSSGEIIHWGGKWDSKALDVYRDFTAKSAGETPVFSGRFPYALAELLQPYRLTDKKASIETTQLKDIIEKEFLHVLDRQSGGKVKEWLEAQQYLDEPGLSQLEDFPNLFLASAFMNRQRGDA